MKGGRVCARSSAAARLEGTSWKVTCWWCPSSCTSVLSAPTPPNRRASLSGTSARTRGSGPILVRPVARGSLGRSICGVTRSVFIDPTVQSSARAAEEPSRVTCRRGCGASGCVTVAPALRTRATTMTN